MIAGGKFWRSAPQHFGAIPLAIGCLLSIALLTSCTSPSTQVKHAQLVALGTVVDVTLWDVSEEQASAAVAAVRESMNEVNDRWHAWHPSDLSNINAHLARGEPAPVDPPTAALLAKAKSLALASGERFNPAIGHLIGLWGFAADEPPTGPPPPTQDVAALVGQAPSLAHLAIENGAVRSTNAQVKIDMGGFAKGVAVDAAIERLQRLGIRDAIVNAGGDLRAIGSKGGQPWRVGIRNPRGNGVIAAIEVKDDETVFTSGDYERYFEYEGQRYHHIINPATGYPSQGTMSVTVLHGDATTADAAATALVVAGSLHWREVARNMGVRHVMLITSEFDVYLTGPMAERVRFTIEPKSKQVVP